MRIGTVFISLLVLAVLAGCERDRQGPFIAVNQAGYPAEGEKQALLVNRTAETFELRTSDGSRVAWSGTVSEPRLPDTVSGDTTSLIDFSGFDTPGEYRLHVDGNPPLQSSSFRIGDNPYRAALATAVQSFYYNRCGTEVDNGRPWTHGVCHTDDAIYYSDSTRHRDVTGGWHDAGDHGKFSVNTALTIGLMLSLYDQRPELFEDGALNIPEGDNGVPDLLDEVRWALEWMMRMQNGEGAVHHKVSQKEWIGEFMPDEDPSTRYLFEVSSTSTGGFAAAAALASRLWEPWDSDFAGRLSDASQRAWNYLEEHHDIVPEGGFVNPSDVHGGGYGDESDRDERAWAAIERYKLTGDERYLASFDTLRSAGSPPPLSWQNVDGLAYGAFINAELPPEYESVRRQVTAVLESAAERLTETGEKNNYGSLLRSDEYYWGSATVNLGYAFLLIQLHRRTGEERWRRAALDQLHYTLGRNPNNRSYLTGIGSDPVRHPYHQFSMEDGVGAPVPGMMVGGPNNLLHLEGEQPTRYPAKSYADEEHNYLDNEVAINFTGVFIYTAGYFASQQNVLSFKSRY